MPPRIPQTRPLLSQFEPGTTIDTHGRYLIRETIGKGGFAEAYLVFDGQLNRFCVAKRQVTNPAWSEPLRRQAELNFKREAELLVTLNAPGHPNIPEIYEYLPEQNCLVMKYVEGRDLGQILRDRGGRLAIAEALAIVRDVASALAYMHSRRPEPVLHRDVKPSNILIDSAERVWLIDFGLSRLAPVQTSFSTPASQLGGTLGFTPPEQWRGQAQARSDVYALSVTLHMLLTGYQPLLSRDDLPALLAGTLAPYPLVRSINPAVHPKIESLIAHGLAFQLEERPSAVQFYTVITQILALNERAQLQAPDGTLIADEHALVTWAEQHWEQAARWLYHNLPEQASQIWGRNKLAADMRAVVARHPNDQNAGLDELLAILDPENFAAEQPQISADRTLLNFGALALDERRDEWIMLTNPGRRYVRVLIQAPRWASPSLSAISLPPGQKQRLKLSADMRRVTESGRLRETLFLKDDHTDVTFRVELQVQLSRWRAFWLRTVAGQRDPDWQGGQVRLLRTIQAHRGAVWALDFGSAGLQLASGGWDQAVRLWRMPDGALISTLDEHAGNLLNLRISPDGLLVAATSSDQYMKLWSIRNGRLIHTLRTRAYQESVHFSPGGDMLISNGSDATITYWRVQNGQAVQHIPTVAHAINLACRPDGQVLAVGCDDRRIRLYDGEQGSLLMTLEGHHDAVSCLAYSSDGTLLVSGGLDGNLCLWEGESGTLRLRLRGHQNAVRTVAVHPHGQMIASGGVDGTIQLWRTSDGALRQVLSGHHSGVLRVVFNPNGAMLASGGGDGMLMLWQPA